MGIIVTEKVATVLVEISSGVDDYEGTKVCTWRLMVILLLILLAPFLLIPVQLRNFSRFVCIPKTSFEKLIEDSP